MILFDQITIRKILLLKVKFCLLTRNFYLRYLSNYDRSYLFILAIHRQEIMNCWSSGVAADEHIQKPDKRYNAGKGKRKPQGPLSYSKVEEEDFRRRLAILENEKQQMHRQQTAFVEQIEKEKRALIQKYNHELSKQRSTIQEYQDRQNRFKKAIKLQAEENCTIITKFIDNVTSLQQIQELDQIKKMDRQIDFKSILDFFGRQHSRSSIHQTSDILVAQLLQVYCLCKESKIYEKKLLLCVNYYIKLLEEILNKGYSQNLDDRQMKIARTVTKEIDKQLYQKFEKLIDLTKKNFTKQRQRILEESKINNSLQQIKLRNMNEVLQKRIQNLLDENERYKSENSFFHSLTLPTFREQINRKETKLVEQIKQMLIAVQRETRDQMNQKFKNIQTLISGSNIVYATQKMNEILKQKDIKIQILQEQQKKFVKEKSRLSEETEADRRQLGNDHLVKEKQIEQLQKKIKELEEKVNQSNLITMKEQDNAQIIKLNEQILNKEKEINQLKLQISQLTHHQLQYDQASQQKEEISRLSLQIRNYQLRIDQMTTKINELESTNKNFNDEIIELKKQIQGLQFKVQEYSKREPLLIQENILQQSQERQREENNMQNINLEKQILQTENQSLKIININLLKQTQTHNNIIQQLEKRIKDLQEINYQGQFKSNDAEIRASKAESQIQNLNNQLAKLEKSKKDDEIELKKAKIERQSLKIKLHQLNSKLEAITNQKYLLIKQISEQKELCIELQKRIEALQNHITANSGKYKITASFVQHKILFIGSILEKRKGQKKFLMSSIEELMGRQIEKTQRLYDFKRDGKSNFHTFIDGHRNIVLIVQTQKAIIACYYSGIVQEAPMTEEGLILSLDTRKKFFLNTFKNNPSKDPKDNRLIRGMIYDKFFLIFGNAEVRIRAGESKVFSNFGIMNSNFDSKKEKVDALLHLGSTNEVEFINYEIHEVVLSEEQFQYEQTSQ